MSDFVLSTEGQTGTAGFKSKYIKVGTVEHCRIVDLVFELIGNNNSPACKLKVMSLENEGDTNEYGDGQLSSSDAWWFTEKAAGQTIKRFSNIRDALGAKIDDIKVEGLSEESVRSYCEQVKARFVGKEGLFLIGGKWGADGKLYSQIYDWDFVAPNTKEGRQKLEDDLARLKASGKHIKGDAPAGQSQGSETMPTSQPTNFKSL